MRVKSMYMQRKAATKPHYLFIQKMDKSLSNICNSTDITIRMNPNYSMVPLESFGASFDVKILPSSVLHELELLLGYTLRPGDTRLISCSGGAAPPRRIALTINKHPCTSTCDMITVVVVQSAERRVRLGKELVSEAGAMLPRPGWSLTGLNLYLSSG